MSETGIPQADGHLLTEGRRFVLCDPTVDLAIDTTRRLVVPGDDFYRFSWELGYANGLWRRQYERRGDAVIQTMFGRISPWGVRWLKVWDESGDFPILVGTIENVPEGARAEVFYTCRVDISGNSPCAVERIYNFGYRWEGGDSFFHIDPSENPIRMWISDNRNAQWR